KTKELNVDEDEHMFDLSDLADKDSTADPVTTAGEIVTTAGETVTTAGDVSVADDVTLAETLVAIRSSASRPQKLKGVLFKEPCDPTTTSRPQPQIPTKDKGKGIMQEPVKPVKVKGKDQIEYDADIAQRLQAELDEEARLEREREEKASNAALIEEWDSIEARIDVDAQLAERIQAEEREQMSVKEQARLLMEFIAARKKFFAAKRAEEQRNKPPTKAEQRKKICTDMKHMARYKDKNFKGKSFDAIKLMFDKAYKQVNDFVPRVESFEESLGQKDASKQGKNSDKTEELNVAEDEHMFDLSDLVGTKVIADQEETTKVEDKDSTADPVTTISETVTTAVDVSVTDDVTLAETLMAIRSSASRPQ
ncbi:hypothetical protein Tco_0037191, partial [Tanacetum coccineum]